MTIQRQKGPFSGLFRDFRIALYAFLHTKGFYKYIFVTFCIYLLGVYAIVRADVYYIDDWGRAIMGYKEWGNFSRYISLFLSTFMHMDNILSDIAPLTQFVAIAFLSLASVVLVYSVRDLVWGGSDITFPEILDKVGVDRFNSDYIPHKKRVSMLGIIASIPVGLSPYFLSDLSFRFDSPYMALSVLFSVIPFIFIRYIKPYILVSIVCYLGMCMTYQASSGIAIVLVIFFAFIMFNQTNAGLKKTCKFLIASIFSYLFALSFFKFAILHPGSHKQASTDTLSSSNLVSGLVENLDMYLSYLWDDFGWSGIKICFLALLFVFILSAIYQAKINKVLSLLLSIFVILFGLPLSYGVYLVLSEPLVLPRAFIGIGVFAAMLAIYIVSAWRGWAYKRFQEKRQRAHEAVGKNVLQRLFFVTSALVAGFFSWSLVVFAYAYGNALSAQDEFQNFRITILLNDLSNALPKQASYDDYLFRIKGWVTASPVLENSSKSNLLMKRLVFITDGKYWIRTAMKHYGWGEVPDEQLLVTPPSEDPEKIAENPKCNPETAGKILKLINNIYHKIEVYTHCAIITFKGKEKYTYNEIEQDNDK